jgi:hypothetical protein
MNKTIKIRITAFAVLAALVLPSAALAASSQEGYGGPNNVVAGINDSGDDNPTPPAPAPEVAVAADTDEGGSLPFTGADLGVLAAAGGIMLAFGFGLRRLTHRPSQT